MTVVEIEEVARLQAELDAARAELSAAKAKIATLVGCAHHRQILVTPHGPWIICFDCGARAQVGLRAASHWHRPTLVGAL